MHTGIYQFLCQFTTPATMPEFKGSTLRGAFGHSLKQVVCALRRQQCPSCLLSASCAYAFIFEAEKQHTEVRGQKARLVTRPHPYVLVPPLTPRQAYHEGEDFTFALTLFGRGNDYLPHLLYAVEQMGDFGLGKGAGEGKGKGRFRLLTMHSGGDTRYDGESRMITEGPPPAPLELNEPPSTPVTALTIRLLTPLRLKHHNYLQDELPFHLLVRAALRRISSLAKTYGNGEPDLDYRGLTRRAEQVAIRHSDCRWQDLRRYSSRQHSAMLIGGIQGRITYQGDLTEFLPLLRFCEQTHLGKQTTFGLGRIEVTAESA